MDADTLDKTLPAVHFENFRCRYNHDGPLRINHIDLTFEQGDFIAIIGPSGGGKSTLAFSINGMIPHEIESSETGGVLDVLDIHVKEQPPHEIMKKVGTVLQDPEWQLVTFTVADEIAFGMENLGVPVPEIEKRIKQLAKLLLLEDLLERSPDELSGGQKQRIAIASCLAMNPPIVLLDEPMAELDPQGKQTVLDAVVSLNKDYGVTVIFIDHNLDIVAPYADYMVVIDQGNAIAKGKPEDILWDKALIDRIRLRPPQSIEIANALPDGLVPDCCPISIEDLVSAVVPPGIDEIDYEPAQTQGNTSSPVLDEVAVIKSLGFTYKDGPHAVRGIDLSIKKGDFIGLIGQNGAGKSTFAKLLTGLLKPDEGEISLLGDPITDLGRMEIANRIGYVFQNPDYQFFSNTVFEEVAFGLKLKKLPQEQIDERVEKVLAQLEVIQYRDEHPHFLSRGERRRVAIATVLALEPQIIILDEPTTGLDTGMATRMLEVVRGLHEAGHTIIMLTHEMRAVLECCNRLVLFSGGQIVMDDDPRKAFLKKDELESYAIHIPPVAAFIGSLPWRSTPLIPRTSEEAALLFTTAINTVK